MTKSQDSIRDEITVDNILTDLSSCFETTYAELLANFMDRSNFKRLKRIGEEQFFAATESNNSIAEESQKIKMQFAEINLLAVSAVNNIETVIAEKFQSDFHELLKEEVLQVILKLDSDQNAAAAEKSKQDQASSAAENSTKKDKDMIIVLDKLKDMSKYFAQNVDEISKQVIDMPLENTSADKDNQTVLSVIKQEKKDTMEEGNDFDMGNISFDSLSSVHTSDLSSFNDDISISSDEEKGEKGKRLTFQMAEEEVWNLRAKRAAVEHESKKQPVKTKSGNEGSEKSTKDLSNSLSKSLPQRKRKPNFKYSSETIISPLMGKSTEKFTTKKNVNSDQDTETFVPRKRGRPRKNLSLNVQKL